MNFAAKFALDTFLNHSVNTETGYSAITSMPPGQMLRFFCLFYNELTPESRSKIDATIQNNFLLKQIHSEYLIIAKSCVYEKTDVIKTILENPTYVEYLGMINVKVETTDTVESLGKKINDQIDTVVALLNSNSQAITNLLTNTVKSMMTAYTQKGGRKKTKKNRRKKSKRSRR